MATVDLHVEWFDGGDRIKIDNEALDFAAQFVSTSARAAWCASQPGFSFESDPASTSTSVVAELGHERNGVFH